MGTLLDGVERLGVVGKAFCAASRKKGLKVFLYIMILEPVSSFDDGQ
jgi:hypothetical protein